MDENGKKFALTLVLWLAFVAFIMLLPLIWFALSGGII